MPITTEVRDLILTEPLVGSAYKEVLEGIARVKDAEGDRETSPVRERQLDRMYEVFGYRVAKLFMDAIPDPLPTAQGNKETA